MAPHRKVLFLLLLLLLLLQVTLWAEMGLKGRQQADPELTG